MGRHYNGLMCSYRFGNNKKDDHAISCRTPRNLSPQEQLNTLAYVLKQRRKGMSIAVMRLISNAAAPASLCAHCVWSYCMPMFIRNNTFDIKIIALEQPCYDIFVFALHHVEQLELDHGKAVDALVDDIVAEARSAELAGRTQEAVQRASALLLCSLISGFTLVAQCLLERIRQGHLTLSQMVYERAMVLCSTFCRCVSIMRLLIELPHLLECRSDDKLGSFLVLKPRSPFGAKVVWALIERLERPSQRSEKTVRALISITSIPGVNSYPRALGRVITALRREGHHYQYRCQSSNIAKEGMLSGSFLRRIYGDPRVSSQDPQGNMVTTVGTGGPNYTECCTIVSQLVRSISTSMGGKNVLLQPSSLRGVVYYLVPILRKMQEKLAEREQTLTEEERQPFDRCPLDSLIKLLSINNNRQKKMCRLQLFWCQVAVLEATTIEERMRVQVNPPEEVTRHVILKQCHIKQKKDESILPPPDDNMKRGGKAYERKKKLWEVEMLNTAATTE